MKRITIQKKGFLYRMDIEKDNLAINEKYNLTIKEAVKYFNIGEKNLRRLVSDNPNADYILMVGNKILIKRKIFEQFIDETGSIKNTLQNICSSDTLPIQWWGVY